MRHGEDVGSCPNLTHPPLAQQSTLPAQPSTPPPVLPAVCSAVTPSINGSYRDEVTRGRGSSPHPQYDPYFYYASLPLRRHRSRQQTLINYPRTLPRNINYYGPRISTREQMYLMQERNPRLSPYRPSVNQEHDRYAVPTFSGILGLGEVLQQYSGSRGKEQVGGSILSSLTTSYTVTTSDTDEDDD